MVHNIKDTSNNGIYHNKRFKEVAESHGLAVERSNKYGWSHTSPTERIIDFLIEHDELNDIEICRTPSLAPVGIGIGTHSGNGKSHSIKYICPCCGNSVRSTKPVNIGCLDCNIAMIQA